LTRDLKEEKITKLQWDQLKTSISNRFIPVEATVSVKTAPNNPTEKVRKQLRQKRTEKVNKRALWKHLSSTTMFMFYFKVC
jgi:hypothetical protein